MMKQIFKKTGLASLFLVVLLLSFSACDSNLERPCNVAPDFSLAIQSFTTVNNVTSVTLGGSVTFSWIITDNDGTFDHISIEPGVKENEKSLTGSATVTPSVPTTYTLKAFSTKDLTTSSASTSITIDVINPNTGGSVEAPAVEEFCDVTSDDDGDGIFTCSVCTDGQDNDYEDGADCADPGCELDSACQPVPTTYTFTPTISVSGGAVYTPGVTAAEDMPQLYIGDQVTLSWISNYPSVQITGFTDCEPDLWYSAEGSYGPCTLSAAEATVTVYGLDGGNFVGNHPVQFSAIERDGGGSGDPPPGFEATVRTSVDNSTVLYGESFSFTYTVSGTYDSIHLSYPGYSGYFTETTKTITSDMVAMSAGTSEVTFNLDVVSNGISKSYPKTVTIKHFTDDNVTTSGDALGSISDFIVTAADNHSYLYGSSAIYDVNFSTDAVSATKYSGMWSGNIVNFIQGASGRYFLTTSDGGLYYSDAFGAFFKIDTGNGLVFGGVYENPDGQLLVGISSSTSSAYGCMYLYYPSNAGSCNSGDHVVGDDSAYCVTTDDNAFEDYISCSYGDNSVTISKFIYNLSAPSHVAVLSNVNTYQSPDGGDTFSASALDSTISNAYWRATDSAPVDGESAEPEGGNFFWTTSRVYYFDDTELQSVSMPSDETMKNSTELPNDINYVIERSGWIFIAADNGVFYGKDGLWYASELTDSVEFLYGTRSGRYSIVYAVTSSGKIYELKWSRMMQVQAPTLGFVIPDTLSSKFSISQVFSAWKSVH